MGKQVFNCLFLLTHTMDWNRLYGALEFTKLYF